MGFNSTNSRSALRSSQKLDEIFGDRLFDWNWATKTQSFRFHGPVIAYEYWWFDIVTDQGKLTRVPKLCIDLDPYTDTYVSDDCPYRRSGLGSQSRFYLVNGIWRKEQDNKPAKLPKPMGSETKLKKVVKKTPDFPDGWEAYQLDIEGGSESWTPNYIFSLTAKNTTDIGDMTKENVYKGKNYDMTDPDYGCDVKFKYDPKGTGTGRYAFSRDSENGINQLSDEELDYLVIKPDVLKFPTPKDAEQEWKQFKESLASEADKKPNGDDRNRGRKSASRLDEDAVDDTPAPRSSRSNGRDADEEAPVTRGRFTRPSAQAGASSSRVGSRKRSNNLDDDIPF